MQGPPTHSYEFLQYAFNALIEHYTKTCPDDKTMHDKLLRQLTGVEGWSRHRTSDTRMQRVLNELIKYIFSQVMNDMYTLYSTGQCDKTKERLQPLVSSIMRGLYL